MGAGKGFTRLNDYSREQCSIRNTFITTAIAELIGTFVFISMIVGGTCYGLIQTYKTGNAAIGWAVSLVTLTIGQMMGIFISGGSSGGHVNPAISLALAISGSLSWAKLPIYWVMQLLGAYLGAGISYWLYIRALKDSIPECSFDLTSCTDGTNLAVVFAPVPQKHLEIAFLDQVLGTGFFLLIILAVIDRRNMKVPQFLYAPIIGLSLGGIATAFGYYAGGAINPARDLGARLMAASVGFPSYHVFNYVEGISEEAYWVAPLFGPLLGGTIAALIYNFFISAHLKEISDINETYVPNRFVSSNGPRAHLGQGSSPDYNPNPQMIYNPNPKHRLQ